MNKPNFTGSNVLITGASSDVNAILPGATTGATRLILRIEGLCVFVAAWLAYARLGDGWGIFAIFFLAPDISLLGYLGGPRVGAVTYNAAHSYMGAILCLIAGFLLPLPVLSWAGMIWSAHIGFDRALGYGLKYSAGFGFTHLGRIGRFSRKIPDVANDN